MKYEYLIIAITGILVFLLALNVKIPGQVTGAVTAEKEESSYGYTVHSIIQEFYGIYDVDFPQGTCTQIAKQLYYDIALKAITASNGYNTKSVERIGMLTFSSGKNTGLLDMVKGRSLTNDPDSDSMISVHTETVVRLPPDRSSRRTFFNLEIHGNAAGNFVVNSGSFSTPALDCTFASLRGVAHCECQTHPVVEEGQFSMV